jgi:NAD(P)-dependent dehydrogenase (short-subunit alcohol dehydrogenase family)
MSDRLVGKHIFLTGAAQGIGLAIAQQCLKEGAKLFIVDRDGPLLRETVAKLGASEGALGHAEADISDMTAIAAAMISAEKTIGPVNALITMPASTSLVRRSKPPMPNGSVVSTSISRAHGTAARQYCRA